MDTRKNYNKILNDFSTHEKQKVSSSYSGEKIKHSRYVIRKISFSNIKGFTKNCASTDGFFHIDFSENTTVLIGKNGTGKTSILEIIAFIAFGYDDRFTSICEKNQIYSPYNSETILKITLQCTSTIISIKYIGEIYKIFFNKKREMDAIETNEYANSAYRLKLDSITVDEKQIDAKLTINDFLYLNKNSNIDIKNIDIIRDFEYCLVDFHTNANAAYFSVGSVVDFLHDEKRNIYKFYNGGKGEVTTTEKRETYRILYDIFNQKLQYDSLPNSATTDTINKTNFIRISEKGKIIYPANLEASGILSLLALILRINYRKDCFVLIDEPESHLHPNFQRKLISFLENCGCQVIIATHSAIMLNFTAMSSNNLIYLVRKKIEPCNYGEIIQELGINPSDVLLANGIIFVEGISDRIYLNCWINLYCKEKGIECPVEGIHYSYIEYGGRCLSHLTFSDIEHENISEYDLSDMLPVLSVTHNYYILMDSDKRCDEHELSETKKRVIEEVSNGNTSNGYWVTEGREIENYIPDNLHDEIGLKKYDSLAELYKNRTQKKLNKKEFAKDICLRLNSENWAKKYKLHDKIANLVENIFRWNV